MGNDHTPIFNVPEPDGNGNKPSDADKDPSRTERFDVPIRPPEPEAEPDGDLLKRETERFDMLSPSDVAVSGEPSEGDGTTTDMPPQEAAREEEAPKEELYVDDIALGGAAIWGFGAVLLILGALGTFLCRNTAIPTAIGAVVTSTALLAIFQKLRMNRWMLNSILFVVAMVIYGLILFPGYKTWFANFSDFWKRIERLTVSVEAKVNDSAGKTEVEVSERGKKAMQKFEEMIDVGTWPLVRTQIQLGLYSLVILFFPLLVVAATPGLGTPVPEGQRAGICAWIGPPIYRTIHRFGRFNMIRFAKALVITALCTVGLALSGIKGCWFIAGIVFCFALICNISPLLALILGGLMIPEAPNKLHATVGVVLTVIALFVAEMKLRQNRSGTSGLILRIVPHLVSVAVFVALGYVVIEVVSTYKANSRRHESIRAANRLMQDDKYAEAVKEYSAILGENEYHPNNLDVMYKILRSRIREENYDQAMKNADRISAWTPDAPTGFMPMFRHKITQILETQNLSVKHRKDKPYEIFVIETHEQDLPEYFTQLGQKILAINPKNEWGHLAAARAAMITKDTQAALTAAKQGLVEAPEMQELLIIQADSLMALQRYDDCIDVCDKILELDNESTTARALRARAKAALRNAGDAPATKQPDPEKKDGATIQPEN